MKTEIVEVDAATARRWLTKNEKNRTIRPGHVEALRQAFLRGEYVQTHQGIAFGTDGHLIDGQHRLQAIASMPDDMTFPMLVTWGLKRDEAFFVVDTTMAKRSVSDVLAVSKAAGECGSFLARIVSVRRCSLTPVYMAPFVEFVSPELAQLVDFCGSARKTWSSAAVRCAAVLSMKDGNADYVKPVYRAMVLADFDGMPSVGKALFKASLAGKIVANSRGDLLCRAIKLFDPKCENLTKVQIIDEAGILAGVKSRLLDQIPAVGSTEQKKAPPVTRGANGVHGINYPASAAA